MVEAGENEGVYLAPLPLDKLRAYRAREVHGNAYRRPRLYGPLTEERVEAPLPPAGPAEGALARPCGYAARAEPPVAFPGACTSKNALRARSAEPSAPRGHEAR